MEGKFRIDYLPTIGAQIYTKVIQDEGGASAKLVVWDISGQPAFRSIRSDYFKGARGIVLVFDLTRPETLEHLESWVNEAVKYTRTPKIVVAGSKFDLEHDRKVLQKTGEEYASKVNGKYLETSAKDGKNVEKLFTVLTDLLMKDSNSS
jgi:small GTP-binding protein